MRSLSLSSLTKTWKVKLTARWRLDVRRVVRGRQIGGRVCSKDGVAWVSSGFMKLKKVILFSFLRIVCFQSSKSFQTFGNLTYHLKNPTRLSTERNLRLFLWQMSNFSYFFYKETHLASKWYHFLGRNALSHGFSPGDIVTGTLSSNSEVLSWEQLIELSRRCPSSIASFPCLQK